jgi:hypothetical protein
VRTFTRLRALSGIQPGALLSLGATVLVLLPCVAFSATTLTFAPVGDATLFQEGDLASGADDGFFSGLNGNTGGFAARRGLVQFDVSAIPSDAVIQQATLTLNVTRTTHAGVVTNTLSRVTQSWGEGTSTAPRGGGIGGDPTSGSATWNFRFWNTIPWSSVGGDFAAAPSASAAVADVGAYSWTSAQLASDVQSWVQTPAGNHGWILIADGPPGMTTAKRFASREFANAAQRPLLSVTYEIAPDNADAPLPLWANIALALGMIGAVAIRVRRTA